MHLITVEKTVEDASLLCLEGERACPPEDCGSYPGYEELLFVLDVDEPGENQQALLEWVGDYDPEHFDLKAANKALMR